MLIAASKTDADSAAVQDDLDEDCSLPAKSGVAPPLAAAERHREVHNSGMSPAVRGTPSLLALGLSHHTAPLELRERVAVNQDEAAALLAELRQQGLPEAVVVSTCNRTEIYAHATDPYRRGQAVLSRWTTALSEAERRAFFMCAGDEAAAHIFRVAASLDSMVVGEPQILGQLKEAVALARQRGHVGPVLDRCLSRAFAVAKRVRSQTAIGAGSVSISSIAADLARKIFGQLKGRAVALLGAGKMGAAAARKLRDEGAQLTVLNRSFARAERLASECGGKSAPFDSLAEHLVSADVLISSVGAAQPVVDAAMIQRAAKARRGRSLFAIDIAVPRSVAAEAGRLDNVFLYNLDDLQEAAGRNLDVRRAAAQQAEAMVAEEVQRFLAWHQTLTLTPTLQALRQRVESVVAAEMARALTRLPEGNDELKASLRAMQNSLVAKLLHAPYSALRHEAERNEGAALLAAVQRLFQLDIDEGDRSR